MGRRSLRRICRMCLSRKALALESTHRARSGARAGRRRLGLEARGGVAASQHHGDGAGRSATLPHAPTDHPLRASTQLAPRDESLASWTTTGCRIYPPPPPPSPHHCRRTWVDPSAAPRRPPPRGGSTMVRGAPRCRRKVGLGPRAAPRSSPLRGGRGGGGVADPGAGLREPSPAQRLSWRPHPGLRRRRRRGSPPS